jgi:hypothetical protein
MRGGWQKDMHSLSKVLRMRGGGKPAWAAGHNITTLKQQMLLPLALHYLLIDSKVGPQAAIYTTLIEYYLNGFHDVVGSC